MSQGHHHWGGPSMTQNQGNSLGDRPCVRQSRLFRMHEGGNAMKDLLGQGNLKWDVNKCEGAYAGLSAADPLQEKVPKQSRASVPQGPPRAVEQWLRKEEPAEPPRNGRNRGNQQTFNLFGGNAEESQASPPIGRNRRVINPQNQKLCSSTDSAEMPQPRQTQPPQPQPQSGNLLSKHRPGAAQANRQTFSIFYDN